MNNDQKRTPDPNQRRLVPNLPMELFNAPDDQKIRGKYTKGIIGNIFVPVGVIATVIALAGVIKAGTSLNGQHALQAAARYRILAQGFTVLSVIAGAIVVGIKENSAGPSEKK